MTLIKHFTNEGIVMQLRDIIECILYDIIANCLLNISFGRKFFYVYNTAPRASTPECIN